MKRGSQLWWIVVALAALGLVVDAQQPGEVGGAGAGTRGAAVAPGRAQGEAYNAPRPPVPAAVVAHGGGVASQTAALPTATTRGRIRGPGTLSATRRRWTIRMASSSSPWSMSRQAEGMPKLAIEADPDIVRRRLPGRQPAAGNWGAPSTLDIVVGNAERARPDSQRRRQTQHCHSYRKTWPASAASTRR